MNRCLSSVVKAVLVLVTATLVSPAVAKEHVSVRVADYPPQYYRNAEGAWTGLDVELARALVLEAGFQPQFVEAPWSRALADIKAGRLDLMTSLSITPERSTYLYWIGPERTSSMVLVVRKQDVGLDIGSMDALLALTVQRGAKIGMQQDVYYGDEFAARLKAPAFASHFDPVADAALNSRKTRAGRILGFFEEKVSMQYQIKTNPDFAGLALHPFTLHNEAVFFGVSRQVSEAVLKRLKEAFIRLEQTGELERIRAQLW